MKISQLAKLSLEELENYYLTDTILDEDGDPIIDEQGNEVANRLESLTDDCLDALKEAGIKSVDVVDTTALGPYFIYCMQNDPSTDQDDALKEIYKKTSPKSRGEMVSLETETDRTLFFDLLPMDVGVVGGDPPTVLVLWRS